jgi:hypothetical protein
MIKRFDEIEKGKSIAVYHGLGGQPAPDRIEYLKSIGFTEVYYPYIDFEEEWLKDKCKSIFQRELRNLRGIDLIMGFSLGGYLAFELGGQLSTNLILINPALDRGRTKLDIKSFDIDSKRNFGKIEVFLGSDDTLIDKNTTLDFLKKERINSEITIIEGMEHRTPMNYFREIINKSKLI